MSSILADNWVDWDGKTLHVYPANTKIDVRFRDSTTSSNVTAKVLYRASEKGHEGKASDIVSYRLASDDCGSNVAILCKELERLWHLEIEVVDLLDSLYSMRLEKDNEKLQKEAFTIECNLRKIANWKIPV